MAGIGFELKHRIPDASLLGHARRLSFAAVIAGGPWIFSIITLLIMTIISLHAGMSRQSLQQFLVTNTYLIAHAQIISGGFQLTLTRYTADLIFTQQQHLVFGNLLGNVIIVSVISMPIGVWLATSLHTMPLAFRCLSAMALPIFCIIWVCILFLSSIKAYRAMTAALLFSYGCIVMQVLLADSHSPTQLLLAFVSGHLIAVLLLMILIWRAYPGHLTVSFSALRWTPTTRRLMLCGLFYNSAIWIDKFIFWLTPGLSKPIAGWFHASLIYDLPIFLANVAIIPGLAIFLLTTETDFATKCQRYFKRLNADATLNELLELKQDLVNSYREGLILLCKVQALTSLILFTYSEPLFNLLHIEPIYRPIFCVDLMGMSFLMLLMSQLNTLFYLNQLRTALQLTIALLLSNGLLTAASVRAGLSFYGYGFSTAALVTCVLGFYLLNNTFTQLEIKSLLQRD